MNISIDIESGTDEPKTNGAHYPKGVSENRICSVKAATLDSHGARNDGVLCRRGEKNSAGGLVCPTIKSRNGNRRWKRNGHLLIIIRSTFSIIKSHPPLSSHEPSMVRDSTDGPKQTRTLSNVVSHTDQAGGSGMRTRAPGGWENRIVVTARKRGSSMRY